MVKIYTALHNSSTGVIEATHENDLLSFCVGDEKYTAPLSALALPYSHPVLVDGYVPLDGFPKGKAQFLYYDMTLNGKMFWAGRKRPTKWRENSSTVRWDVDDPFRGRYADYNERDPFTDYVDVKVERQLFLLAHGHSALIFRVKPRSLERQYMSVEAGKEDVIFRTINK